jgi:invasion protein IalB
MSEKPSTLSSVANAIDAMPPAVKSGLLIVLILVIGGFAGWIGRGALTGPGANNATVAVYDDWRVACPSAKLKDGTCEIAEDVVNPAEGRVARVSFLREKDKKDLTLVLTVPLGVLLEPGLSLRLGGDTLRTYQFKTCTEEGCAVLVPADKDLQQSFAKAQDASLKVVSPSDGKEVDVPVSMKGFPDAYAAFKNGEAKRKSWWWRLWL